MQCHHFAVIIPENAHHVDFVVNSDLNCDMSLMLSKKSFAYPDDAEFISAVGGPHQQLSFSTLESGVWYVAVQCMSTVLVEETKYGQSYIDEFGVLNGIPYLIKASWEIR